MFRTFARLLGLSGANPHDIFLFHPTDLVALLELVWDQRLALAFPPGDPLHRSDLNRFGNTWFGRAAMTAPLPPPSAPGSGQPNIGPLVDRIRRSEGEVPLIWEHLIYAYMIENTRIYEIFRRVVHEFTHGEKLGLPSVATQQWLRTTEELFFRDPSPFFVPALRSDVRPDIGATRRNAYFRLLGMDLNHGTADGKPYGYVRPDAANKEFVATFEELLREVWVAMINASNISGTKATDDAKLVDLVRKLREMLMSRRVGGTLSREEFVFVSMMSWFHETVETAVDAPVVVDLRAQAASGEQRLFKIAQQVGLPAHGLSGSYFEIAESISLILLLIELGAFATTAAVAALYTPGQAAEALMRKIITHWSIITGRDIKAGKVAPSDAPRRVSAPALTPA
jgi:hypothetical protein